MLLVMQTYCEKHMLRDVPAGQILRSLENGFQQPEALMKGKGVFKYTCFFSYHPRTITLLLLLVCYMDMQKMRL